MRYTKIIQETTHKLQVQLFVAGKVFDEIVHARDIKKRNRLHLLATLMHK